MKSRERIAQLEKQVQELAEKLNSLVEAVKPQYGCHLRWWYDDQKMEGYTANIFDGRPVIAELVDGRIEIHLANPD